MKETVYQRKSALDYARQWSVSRNPKYLNFDNFGGDCTNFVSQCLYAGCKVMNPLKTFGWYYYSANNRTPSWTGVMYLYNFLTGNKGVGPYAILSDKNKAVTGDIIQLGNSGGEFYHSLIIVSRNVETIYVAAHTFDTYMKPLDTYNYDRIRFLHIQGVRKY